MNKTASLLLLFLMIISPILAQELSEKELEQLRNSDEWLIGKGIHASEQRADKIALEDLISQVSVKVSSKFIELSAEIGSELNSYTQSVKRTYSSANLNNVSKSVIKNKKDWIVYRYIRRDKMDSLFNQRKALALDYYKRGLEAEDKLEIGDALNNYYWSYIIVRTLPNWDEIYSEEGLLMTILPDNIRRIYRNLTIELSFDPENNTDDTRAIHVSFLYNGMPANNILFRYFFENFWTEAIYFAKSNGQIELNQITGDIPGKLDIDVLYDDEYQAYHNKELANILTEVEKPHFAESSFTIPINRKKLKINKKTKDNHYKLVESLLENAEPNSHENYFLPEAMIKFQRLVSLYNPRLVSSNVSKSYSPVTNNIYLKGIFVELQNSKRKITEELIFQFTEDGRIADFNFALSDPAIDDLIGNIRINDYEREIIINFMQQYKTAYTLKNIDFINQIFADNALIIIGQKLKESQYDPRSEFKPRFQKTWDFIQLTKEEYLKRLELCFENNNFIYLNFEDNNLMRTNHQNKALFGLQIHQYYYSETYSDEGYLFLLFDLTDNSNPIIYVRTWQPEKHPDGSIYGLPDFYLPE